MRLGIRSLIAVFTVALTLTGCRVTEPSVPEAAIINWAKLHVTVGGKGEKNPVHVSVDSIADGKQLFNSYCQVCHGLDGQNTGVPFAKSMSPRVPSLAEARIQAYSDGQLKWIIKNGLYPSGMPASNGEFGDDDMWRMVLYIRHLPPAGSLGDPPVYSGK